MAPVYKTRRTVMTQKEKIIRAGLFARQVKSIAGSIVNECRDYDETWALSYAKDLTERADDLLKSLGK
jgi:hypothetical protein